MNASAQRLRDRAVTVQDAVLDRTVRRAELERRAARRRRLLTAAAITGGAAVLAAVAAVLRNRTRRGTRDGGRIQFEESVTVQVPPDVAYRYWRDISRLPSFLSHLESVEVLDDTHSRWTAAGPAGTHVSWEAEITGDKPGELIGWRSLPGATVPNAGSVRFRPGPGGQSTEVLAELAYSVPAGKVGAAAAGMFGENPERQVREDLRKFQQAVEAQ
jgi:uncharacterized membrane protein